MSDNLATPDTGTAQLLDVAARERRTAVLMDIVLILLIRAVLMVLGQSCPHIQTDPRSHFLAIQDGTAVVLIARRQTVIAALMADTAKPATCACVSARLVQLFAVQISNALLL